MCLYFYQFAAVLARTGGVRTSVRARTGGVRTFPYNLRPYLPVQVASVLARGSVFERASIDEAYLDLTGEAQKLLAGLDVEETGSGLGAEGPDGPVMTADGWAMRGPLAASRHRSGPAALPPPPPFLEQWHVKGLEVRGAA